MASQGKRSGLSTNVRKFWAVQESFSSICMSCSELVLASFCFRILISVGASRGSHVRLYRSIEWYSGKTV